ncbi:MAG: carboxypeptidase-like regulatory domain-containing protein [Bryobacteraceae bacterium]
MKSGEDSAFRFESLFAGGYEVRVIAPGFAIFQQPGGSVQATRLLNAPKPVYPENASAEGR